MVNWDQMALNIVPNCNWTMNEKGAKKVVVEGLSDKHQFTGTTLLGVFLPMQLLYHGKTDRVHPHYQFPSGFDIWHTSNHWANTDTVVHYLNNVIIPYVKLVRETNDMEIDQPALMLLQDIW